MFVRFNLIRFLKTGFGNERQASCIGKDRAQVHRHIVQVWPRPIPDASRQGPVYGTYQEVEDSSCCCCCYSSRSGRRCYQGLSLVISISQCVLTVLQFQNTYWMSLNLFLYLFLYSGILRTLVFRATDVAWITVFGKTILHILNYLNELLTHRWLFSQSVSHIRVIETLVFF